MAPVLVKRGIMRFIPFAALFVGCAVVAVSSAEAKPRKYENREHYSITVRKHRSFLDAGTQVSAGEKSYHDYHRLLTDRLVWVIGRRQGEIFYRDIRRVRLSFRPATMQSYRFIAEIWAPGAPKLTIASTSWHGIAEQRRQDQPYRDFIVALHQRIAAAKSNPLLDAGTHPFLYWPGVVVFAALAIGIIALLKYLAVF